MIRVLLREIVLLLAVTVSISTFAKETRKIVAIVDTGINSLLLDKPFMCKNLHADFTNTSIRDSHGHGTNVAGIIANKLNAKTHCLMIIKYWNTYKNPWGSSTLHKVFSNVIGYLKSVKPAYINFSSSGFGFNPNEFGVFSELIDSGTKIIVAAGNDNLDLSEGCDVFPACYFFNEPNYFVVGASKSPISNKNGPVNAIRSGNNVCGFGVCMTGTSQAAAQFTADLISSRIEQKR